MEGPQYQASKPRGPQDSLVVAYLYITTRVPDGTIMWAFQSHVVLFSCSYADVLGLILDFLIKFRVTAA